MDSGKVFAIVVIGLFAFSIFAVLEYSLTNGGNPTPPTDGNTNLTPVRFQSGSIDANVVELFPYLIVTANTSQTNIDLIDAQVYQVPGVLKVQSQFVSQNGIQYFAYVQYSAESNAAAVLNGLKAIPSISSIEAKQQGLIQLPSPFTISNSTLNISKTFFPPNVLTQAILSLDVQKGQSVKVKVTVDLVNETPSQVVAEQVETPKEILLSQKLRIARLDDLLFVQGKTTDANLDANGLRNLLFQGKDANNVQVQLVRATLEFLAYVYLDVNANAVASANSAKALLLGKAKDVEVFQQGAVELSDVYDISEDKHYPLAQTIVSAALVPGRLVDENVWVQIYASVLNGQVQQLQIIETDKQFG
ncbi:MAG: hypothetical protein V1847_00350 [Candidatus Diapherotrites archaeon]